MKKIFTINQDHFATGYSKYGDYLQRGGLFTDARGIQLFDYTNGLNNGLIQAGNEGTEYGDGVVVDNPFAGTSKVTGVGTGSLYIWGDAGNLYTKPLNSNTVTLERTVANPANGLELFQPNSGTEYLYYWQKTQIGRWDLASTYVDAQYTGLESTIYHPTHKFLRGIWYGNGDRIGSIVDDLAGDVTHSTNDLDFSSSFSCTALTDDGFYLVGALNQNAGDSFNHAESKIIFWDTFGSTWQREWNIPAAAIMGISSVGRTIFIVASNGIYICSFNDTPQLLYSLVISSAGSNAFLASQAVIRYMNGILFNVGNQVDGQAAGLQFFGEIIPGQGFLYYTPSVGVDSKMLLQVKDNSIFTGDGNNNLFDFAPLGDAGAVTTTHTAETKYIDLKGKWDVKRIDITFVDKLLTTDVVNIDVQFDEDVGAVDWGTASNVNDGAVRTVKLHDINGIANDVEVLKLYINITGGNPKILRISVYGDPKEN